MPIKLYKDSNVYASFPCPPMRKKVTHSWRWRCHRARGGWDIRETLTAQQTSLKSIQLAVLSLERSYSYRITRTLYTHRHNARVCGANDWVGFPCHIKTQCQISKSEIQDTAAVMLQNSFQPPPDWIHSVLAPTGILLPTYSHLLELAS